MINKKQLERAFQGLFISLVLLFSWLLYFFPNNYLEIFVLNVGQGESILIKTPENHHILVDGGPGDLVIEELLDVLPYFNRELDLVILTHPHQDHVEGLIEVLRRFEVKAVLVTKIEADSIVYGEFLDLIEDQTVLVADDEQDFYFGEILLDVIYPFEPLDGQAIKNLNNSSIVFKLVYGDFSMLFTGDIEKEIESLLAGQNINLQADVLKVAHQGSKTSSTPEFLKKVKAEMAVISAGLANRYGHPHGEVLKNLRKANIKTIKRTDQQGRIRIRANPD
jgi:competence protein ComEC